MPRAPAGGRAWSVRSWSSSAWPARSRPSPTPARRAQSAEPPLADPDAQAVPKKDKPPAADPAVTPADYVVPLVRGPEVVQTAGTAVVPATAIPTPVLTLSVEGLAVASVGQDVAFKLTVRNVSQAKAHQVVVRATPPKGCKLKSSAPPVKEDEAEVQWHLDVLEAGGVRTFEVAFAPDKDVTEAKLLARVKYEFGRGLVTKIAPPTLALTLAGPKKGVVGEKLTYRVELTNPGKVAVADAKVTEFLEDALNYDRDAVPAAGVVPPCAYDTKHKTRTWDFGTLPPGDRRAFDLKVTPRQVGAVRLRTEAAGSGVRQEAVCDADILDAKLTLKADPPAGGGGTVHQPIPFRATIRNDGSADLANVVVRATFPPDMKPAKASNGSTVQRDAVVWTVPVLKKGEAKDLNLALTPSTTGPHKVTFAAKADHGGEQTSAATAAVAGVSALHWDTTGPPLAQVGGPVVYRVVVENTGTAPAKAVLVKADVSEQVEIKDVSPAGAVTPEKRGVLFQTVEVPAGKKVTFLITGTAKAKGAASATFALSEEGKPASTHRKETTVGGDDGPAR